MDEDFADAHRWKEQPEGEAEGAAIEEGRDEGMEAEPAMEEGMDEGIEVGPAMGEAVGIEGQARKGRRAWVRGGGRPRGVSRGRGRGRGRGTSRGKGKDSDDQLFLSRLNAQEKMKSAAVREGETNAALGVDPLNIELAHAAGVASGVA